MDSWKLYERLFRHWLWINIFNPFNWILAMRILYICSLSMLLFLSSCTTSVSFVNTQGTASDVIDENQTPTTDISPNVSVSAIPGK